jgi:hypothetical protein
MKASLKSHKNIRIKSLRPKLISHCERPFTRALH